MFVRVRVRVCALVVACMCVYVRVSDCVHVCVRAHAFCVREQENERERLYGMPLASLSLAGDCCFRKKGKKCFVKCTLKTKMCFFSKSTFLVGENFSIFLVQLRN